MSRDPLRVAMVVRAYPTVSETFIQDQIDALRKAGHRVDLFSLYAGHTAEEPDGATDDRACYLIGPEVALARALTRAAGRLLRSSGSPALLFEVARTASRQPRIAAEAVHAIPVLRGRELEYDVIHAHFGPTGLLAALLRRIPLMRGALVTTFHGVDVTRYPTGRGPDVYGDLFGLGEMFTVNSRFLEERVIRLGAPPDRVRRLPVGVDLDRFPCAPRTWTSGEPVRLLTVGRLEEVKGIRYGLEAVARLARAGVDARYTVVGGGRLASELAARADRLGIADRTRFTGPMPPGTVLAEYYAHHLFLLPGVETSDGQVEAQGRVLVEAQATGMPVIASGVGGVPETVGEGAGLLVPPADPRAIEEGVADLLHRVDEWTEIGRRGRAHVSRSFAQDDLLDRLLDIYESASSIGPRKAGHR